ncbi:MAG: flavodoxin family protein [Dehalococcoidia bacterium]
MKVLGIMGSPRRRGNTDFLLDEALKGARSGGAEVEKLAVEELEIAPCREIYACLKDGHCSIEDDMQQVYPKLLEVEGLILASPIFFYGLTSQVKALIDRCQALWVMKHRRAAPAKRKGAFIAVGATRGERLFDGAVLTVKYFFDAIGVEYSGDLLIGGVDKKGHIRKQPAALAQAFALGKSLVPGDAPIPDEDPPR